MQQLTLLDDDSEIRQDLSNTIRPYQARIVGEAVSSLRLGRSPLVEMATGTGKTRVAAEICGQVKDWPVLWMAHRTELIWQASNALSGFLGEQVGHELPDLHSSRERIVVASKDTIRQPRRLERLKDIGREPRLIVIDEAHHAAAKSYKTVLEQFPQALRLGLSATPDRLDRRKLLCFDTVTTPYRIVDAIADSWLVPIKAKRVHVEAVDISGVGIVAGDLNQGQLELVMSSERALHGCAKGLLEYAGDRPTIAFSPGVDSARRLCEILHRYVPGCARFVSGDTEASQRSNCFRTFGKDYQFLINVAVATEGTDLPAAACIAMLRPTKSRGLYVQMLGRGTRPLPGLCGVFPEDRSKWILQSGKPDCLVLDFIGNTGKHSVVTAFDIAGHDETVARKASKRGTRPLPGLLGLLPEGFQDGDVVDVFEALRLEEERGQAAAEKRKAKEARAALDRAKLVASVRLSVTDTELIGLGQVKGLDESDPFWHDVLTPGQAEQILKLGLPLPSEGETYSKGQARKMILEERRRRGLATDKQIDFIRRHYDTRSINLAELTKGQAKSMILKKLRSWT